MIDIQNPIGPFASGFTFDEGLFSDLYKDCFGFRPRDHEFWIATPERKQEIWDSLLLNLADEIIRERNEQEEMLKEFMNLIQINMKNGAADEKTAIRWILDVEGFDEFDLANGPDYVAFRFGLNYSNPYRDVIAEVINEMKEN